jgi:hypothetical protein
MKKGGRIVAITYRPGVLTASWQPFVAQGSGKAALESLVRYSAVALASRGLINGKRDQPWDYGGQYLEQFLPGRAGRDTCLAPNRLDADGPTGNAGGHR